MVPTKYDYKWVNFKTVNVFMLEMYFSCLMMRFLRLSKKDYWCQQKSLLSAVKIIKNVGERKIIKFSKLDQKQQ